jgi:hypothetical protein
MEEVCHCWNLALICYKGMLAPVLDYLRNWFFKRMILSKSDSLALSELEKNYFF